jgi:hypothetical protein
MCSASDLVYALGHKVIASGKGSWSSPLPYSPSSPLPSRRSRLQCQRALLPRTRGMESGWISAMDGELSEQHQQQEQQQQQKMLLVRKECGRWDGARASGGDRIGQVTGEPLSEERATAVASEAHEEDAGGCEKKEEREEPQEESATAVASKADEEEAGGCEKKEEREEPQEERATAAAPISKNDEEASTRLEREEEGGAVPEEGPQATSDPNEEASACGEKWGSEAWEGGTWWTAVAGASSTDNSGAQPWKQQRSGRKIAKWCTFFASGLCERGDYCTFAHWATDFGTEWADRPALRRMVLCRYYERGIHVSYVGRERNLLSIVARIDHQRF